MKEVGRGSDLGAKVELAKQAPPAIKVENLRKSAGGQTILAEVSFEITSGELLVLLGPSGTGKTTLLRIIAGLEPADSGVIHLQGRLSHQLPPQERRLGVVFQEHALFRRMTVEQNIAFGLKIRKLPHEEIRRRVEEMLDLIRLREHRRKYPANLSGGQRQRVGLARALACKPEALLLDEPFNALDPITRAELRREVRLLLRRLNLPALFITHDQEEALELGDRIAVLHNGRIEQIAPPVEVYNHPKSEFVATFLGAANVLLGRWRKGEVAIGALNLKPPADLPTLLERQPVKIVFRPEDLVLNFQPQLLDTPYYLGRGVVEEVSYVGSGERLLVRLSLLSSLERAGSRQQNPGLFLVDETFAEGFPITVTRGKWEANEMELSVGDPVAIGLKQYRLMPHYPLR